MGYNKKGQHNHNDAPNNPILFILSIFFFLWIVSYTGVILAVFLTYLSAHIANYVSENAVMGDINYNDELNEKEEPIVDSKKEETLNDENTTSL